MSASGAISTLVWAIIVIVVVIILVVVLFKLLAYLFVLPEVYGQTNNKTLTTFQPTTGENRITSSLQFIPQQAWVQTIPTCWRSIFWFCFFYY